MYISINELSLRRIFFSLSWTNAICNFKCIDTVKHLLHKYYNHKASFFMTYYLVPLLKKFQLYSGFGSFVLDSYELLWDLSYYSTPCHHFFDNWRRQTWVANEEDATRHLGAPCFRWLRRKSRRTLWLNSFEIAFTFQTFNVF